MRPLLFLVVILGLGILLIAVLSVKKEEPKVPIMAEFENKIVYGTDGNLNQEELRKDCSARGGQFNTCGSVCGPKEEICIQVCAFTCEFR